MAVTKWHLVRPIYVIIMFRLEIRVNFNIKSCRLLQTLTPSYSLARASNSNELDLFAELEKSLSQKLELVNILG